MAKGKYQRWLERDGLTDEQLAGKMGINPATLYDWKNKYPKISEALKKGKEVVDIQVENALLKRALGYDYQEQRIEKSDKDGTKIIQTIRHIPADTTAQIFWLKNRRPDKWRDKPEVSALPNDAIKEDGLSQSLREMAEELESDA